MFFSDFFLDEWIVQKELRGSTIEKIRKCLYEKLGLEQKIL